ncbi:hypothetical protein KKC32_04390 [Patescibacteria group bacterium]|nr:hypothetical protein [Patescibacteria group bacterium]
MKSIMKKFFGIGTSKEVTFFGLSSREQKRIVQKAAEGAIKEQRKLLDTYQTAYKSK